jgi:hypothetical protein
MGKSLEEIRAQLLAKQERQERAQNGGSFQSNEIFPFWNAPFDSTTLVRFLPDGNDDNTFFWEERQMIKMPFNGIKGEHSNPVVVQVPCMEMYGASCPVLAQIRPLWKGDEEDKKLASTYWKKKSYILQGFVVNAPFEEKDVPEFAIRRFILNSSIFKLISASLMDPEIEHSPVDIQNGLDFKLIKTQQGKWANYSTSTWARRPRPLTQGEIESLKEKGLYVLKDYLPKRPTEDEVRIIGEMFTASFNGLPYDGEKWGQAFRPFGFKAPAEAEVESGTRSAPSTAKAKLPAEVADAPAPSASVNSALADLQTRTAPKAAVVEDEVPFETKAAPTPAASDDDDIDDILATIQKRRASQQNG